MRVRSTSLNYRDLMVLKGGGRGPTKLGVDYAAGICSGWTESAPGRRSVPLSDGAGEVAAIGEYVTRQAMIALWRKRRLIANSWVLSRLCSPLHGARLAGRPSIRRLIRRLSHCARGIP
jgi:hypothetical protein